MSKKGYTVKKRGARHSHQLPIYCPYCRRLTGTIDDKYLLSYGICSVCYVEHVEERIIPTIDLKKYLP